MFALAISGFVANFFSRKEIVPSVGRVNSQDMSPNANMFFERSASRLVTSNSLSASIVSEVSGTACTWYSSTEPSSSGLTV